MFPLISYACFEKKFGHGVVVVVLLHVFLVSELRKSMITGGKKRTSLGLFLVKPQQDYFAKKPTNMEKKKLLESRCSPSYIHDMMSTLSKNNSVEKLAEIDEIGFRFLRLVPNWSVKQAIMVHLVESYQVKQRTFILDTDNIRLNTELIGK
ncbi:hypothetical protein S83_051729, partial [Arachis hypogaea]